MRIARIDMPAIHGYVVHRKQQGAAPATVNRELATLSKGLRVAHQNKKLAGQPPRIEKLQEDNIRQGFFEREQFEAVRKHLPAYAQPVVTFMYMTGWRIRSEGLPLQWRQVDFQAGTVRLEPGTTKNKDGRTFPGRRAVRGSGGGARGGQREWCARTPIVRCTRFRRRRRSHSW